MYNITLIGTIHSENGKCDPDELYKILKDINPEVIFVELPDHYADFYFSDSFDTYCANNILLNRSPPVVPLEVKCLKKYIQNHDIKIIPVDIDLTQKLQEYQQEIYHLFSVFFKDKDYQMLDNEKETLIAKEGFHFLNSNKFLEFSEKKEMMEKKIIESEIQKNRLLVIYKLFHSEQYDNRENAMLQNIYSYSIQNQFNKAVFLIGAEHKRSIVKKIKEYEKLSGTKLNWTMYGDK